MSRFNRSLDCKVYVGNLGPGASRHELEDAFSEYGELTNVWVARNPPGFAFVEFKSRHDARDAAEGMDNRFICGRKIAAEMSNGESRRSRGGYGGGGGRYPPRRPISDEKCYECGERGHFARECAYNRRRGRRSRSRSRSRSYSPRRRRSRSSNRNYSHRDRSHSRSRSRSHSRYSPVRRSQSLDRD